MNNQQYALKNITFTGCNTTIAIQHAFVLSFPQLHFLDRGIAIDMSGHDTAGPMSSIDSSAYSVGNVVNGAANTVLGKLAVANPGPTLSVDGERKITGSLLGQTYMYSHVYNNTMGPQI